MSPRHMGVESRKIGDAWARWFRSGRLFIHQCCYCGVQLCRGFGIDTEDLTHATREHPLPRSRGGKEKDWLWACLGCNRDKHHLTVNEYRLVLMFRKRKFVVFYFERQRALQWFKERYEDFIYRRQPRQDGSSPAVA